MNSMLNVSELCLQGIVLYSAWLYGALGPHNALLYGLFLLSSLCVALDIFRLKKFDLKMVYSIVPCLVVYAMTSFVSGLFTCINLEHFLKSIQNFTIYTIICFKINYISIKKGSMEWILKALVLSGALIVITNLFFGLRTDHTVGININKMSEFSNPNGEGFVLVFATFSALLLSNARLNFTNVLFILLIVYTLFIGASRKSFIAECAIILYATMSILFCKNNNLKSKIKRITLIILIIISSVVLLNVFEHTPIYQRLYLLESGFNDRLNLVNNALILFLENPFFGVGFKQYELYFEMYSHNTYFEILSCTGLIGVFVWLLFIPKLCYKEFVVRKKMYESKKIYGLIVLMFMIMLFFGSGSILYYDLVSLITVNYLLSYTYIRMVKNQYNQN